MLIEAGDATRDGGTSAGSAGTMKGSNGMTGSFSHSSSEEEDEEEDEPSAAQILALTEDARRMGGVR